MPTRPLGQLGWQASALTLGGVKWDAMIPEADAVKLIQRALELGVNTFDTAPIYGAGKSETRLGMALAGVRDRVWINTKTSQREGGAARRDIDTSLQRLKTDRIDLLLVHGLDNDDDVRKVLAPGGVLTVLEEYKKAGHVRHIGVSAHHYKHNLERILGEYRFDAVLMPAGLFNLGYNYSFIDSVLPGARRIGAAVLGMKIFGAGRVKHAASIEPYLRYSLNLPIDSLVIGCESIEQLEQTVRIVKRRPAGLSGEEITAMLPEAVRVTQAWDAGEFNWVRHYVEAASQGR